MPVLSKQFYCQNTYCSKELFYFKNVKAQVILKSAEAQSLTSIGIVQFHLQPVQRQINQAAKQFIPNYKVLPKHLPFDEFKYAKGEMAFEYINAESGDILDILDRRDNLTIMNHFIVHFSLTERLQVETVTIDMNAGYVSVIKELFPRAKIIIGRD